MQHAVLEFNSLANQIRAWSSSASANWTSFLWLELSSEWIIEYLLNYFLELLDDKPDILEYF